MCVSEIDGERVVVRLFRGPIHGAEELKIEAERQNYSKQKTNRRLDIPWKAFELSSADKKQSPPGLSVWDSAHTTAEQAAAFTCERCTKREGTPSDYSGLSATLKVSAIVHVGDHPDRQGNGLKVVSTPHNAEHMDGYLGHCDIRGLDALDRRLRVTAYKLLAASATLDGSVVHTHKEASS